MDSLIKVALITGGASGIGKIMARLLLDQGVVVVLWDINSEALESVAAAYCGQGTIKTYCVDVSDPGQVQATARMVLEEVGSVDLLINNAGIVVGKYFHKQQEEEMMRTLAVNTAAVMRVTRAFLPDMMARHRGHICNIASAGGLLGNPGMAVYAASKWAVIGWSESLRLEMQRMAASIRVTTVMPYYIDTGMFDGVKSKIPVLRPEAAARAILRAIEQRRALVSFPRYIYRSLRLAQALLPLRVYDWLVGEVFGIYHTMEGFRGRKDRE